MKSFLLLFLFAAARCVAPVEYLEEMDEQFEDDADLVPSDVASLLEEAVATGVLASEADAADVLAGFAPETKELLKYSHFPFVDVLGTLSFDDLSTFGQVRGSYSLVIR